MLAMYAGSGSGSRAAIRLLDYSTNDVIESALITCPLGYRSRWPVRIGGKIYGLLQQASGSVAFFPDAHRKLYAEDMTSMLFADRVITPCTNATEVVAIDWATQREIVVFDIGDITTETRRYPITSNPGAYYFHLSINESNGVAVGFDDGAYRVRVFDLASGSLIHEKAFPDNLVDIVAISDNYFAVFFYKTIPPTGDTIRVYSLATGDALSELTIPGFNRSSMWMNDNFIGNGVEDAVGNPVEIYALSDGGTSITLDKTVDAFAAQKAELGLATLPGFSYASAG